MKDRVRPLLKPLLGAAVGAFVLLTLAAAVALLLLRHWGLAAGGEPDAGRWVRGTPAPQLQTAPQLDRAEQAPGFEQHRGQAVPPGLTLRDEAGRAVGPSALASPGRATVLLPADYRCRTLCGTTAHGVLEALADTGLPPSEWQLVLFSFDARDTPADAARLRPAYAGYAAWARPAVFRDEAALPLHLLTGDAADTGALARAIGFSWQDDPRAAGDPDAVPDHPTGIVVLTPDGRISRYFFGVRYDSSALRSAIVEATEGRMGALADRLRIVCAHLDPLAHPHDGPVLALARVVGLATLALLGFGLWRLQARRGRRVPPGGAA